MPEAGRTVGKDGGVNVHDYVYIAIGVVALVLVVAVAVYGSVSGDQSRPGSHYTPLPPGNLDDRRRDSDLYRRSYAARDVAPPARVAMGLPPYHNEADWH